MMDLHTYGTRRQEHGQERLNVRPGRAQKGRAYLSFVRLEQRWTASSYLWRGHGVKLEGSSFNQFPCQFHFFTCTKSLR